MAKYEKFTDLPTHLNRPIPKCIEDNENVVAQIKQLKFRRKKRNTKIEEEEMKDD